MPERILVPLDGSPLSARVVPWADDLARALRAEIELLHVVQPDTRLESLEAEVELNRRFMPPRPEEARVEQRYADQLEAVTAEAARTLDAVASGLHGAATVVSAVRRGDPVDMIIAYAVERDASLITMATHAREGLARTFVGSVAAAVLRRSHIPVMLLNPHLTTTPRAPERILVTLDGSKLADAILDAVIPLAEQLGATVVLFTVETLPPLSIPVQGARIPLGLPLPHSPAEVAQHLEQKAEDARRRGVAAEVAAAPPGERAPTIAWSAIDQQCDLIAMSTHGRNGLGRWLVGSVTDAVVRTADVPVLAICPADVHEAHRAR